MAVCDDETTGKLCAAKAARGGCYGNFDLVDEAALAAALRSGHVGAAALDVRAAEPYRHATSPLAAAPNCFHAPHSAWYSPESRTEMREKGARAARRAIAREEPRNVVNAAWLA